VGGPLDVINPRKKKNLGVGNIEWWESEGGHLIRVSEGEGICYHSGEVAAPELKEEWG